MRSTSLYSRARACSDNKRCASPLKITVCRRQAPTYHILQGLQSVNVLSRQHLVEGAQALAKFDVQPSILQCPRHNSVCCTLVAGEDPTVVLRAVLKKDT